MKELEIYASNYSFGVLGEAMQEAGIRSEVIDHLLIHERKHFQADSERTGKEKLGFIINDGWIMAYYMVVDDKSPENLMGIASAPGYREMSEMDWNVYKNAWVNSIKEKNESGKDVLANPDFGKSSEDIEPPSQDNSFDINDLIPHFIDTDHLESEHLMHPGLTRKDIVNSFAREIDKLIDSGVVPPFKDVLNLSLNEFLAFYGDELNKCYKGVINELSISKKDESPKLNGGIDNLVSTESEEKTRVRLKYGDPGWWDNLPPEFKWLERYREQGLPFDEIAPYLKSLTYEIETVVDAFPSF